MERFSRDDSFLSTISPGDENRGERSNGNELPSRVDVVNPIGESGGTGERGASTTTLMGWPVNGASTFSLEQSLPSFNSFSIPRLELPLVETLIQDLNFDFVVVNELSAEREREGGRNASENGGRELEGRSSTEVATPSYSPSSSAERDVLEDGSLTPSAVRELTTEESSVDEESETSELPDTLEEAEPDDEAVSDEPASEEEGVTFGEEASFEEESGSAQTPTEELNGTEETGATEGATSDTVADLQPAVGSELYPDQVKMTAVFSDENGVNALDIDKIYQFSVAESGVFTAQLSDLTGDADVQLIEDRNRNGVVDQGEIIAWQWERGTTGESIRKFVEEGDYFLRVKSHQESSADYQLTTDFTASATDDLSFSIVINPRGLEGLNEQAQAAIYQAARDIEGIITHSSLGRSHVLNVNIFGTINDRERYLAFAGPQSYLRDSNDRLIPSKGFGMINKYYADTYNSNPAYLRQVMRHELGHILGVGTIWTSDDVLVGGDALVVNDFIDLDSQTYRADTYAGQAYGELLGGPETAIPLSSDKAHWSESVLDRELMTPRAEGVSEQLPLSQITIASLRDLGWNVNYGAAEVNTLAALVAPSGSTFA